LYSSRPSSWLERISDPKSGHNELTALFEARISFVLTQQGIVRHKLKILSHFLRYLPVELAADVLQEDLLCGGPLFGHDP
ncbi:MAG: hypothetical protein ACKO39_11280, partial [Chthoniobacterales bacterium]